MYEPLLAGLEDVPELTEPLLTDELPLEAGTVDEDFVEYEVPEPDLAATLRDEVAETVDEALVPDEVFEPVLLTVEPPLEGMVMDLPEPTERPDATALLLAAPLGP